MKVDVKYYKSSKEYLVYFNNLSFAQKHCLELVLKMIGYKIKDNTKSSISIRANYIPIKPNRKLMA